MIKATSGYAQIMSSLHLKIGIAVTPRSPRTYLFEGLSFTPSDVGQTFIASSASDPDFDAFTALFTDGIQSYFMWDDDGSGNLLPEVSFFPTFPPSNNGVDLGGFQIDYLALRFDSLEFFSPGTDPNGNGIWTDYNYVATLSVYGQPVTVPEPSSFTTFGILVLFARNRILRSS